MKHENKPIRWDVFIPCFVVIGGAALLGIVNNSWLASVTYTMFDWSLSTFGWLYQIVAMVTLLLAALLLFTKVGKIRFGGPEAKAKHSFGSWFAMTLTGGIATGLITYGVNEVLIYYGNIYGELDGYGITPLTQEAELFAMGRCFYNWTFIPYAMYALSGVLIAYMYFNRKKQLSVAASLTPIFGEKVTQGIWVVLVDVLSVLAIALGLASSLGAGLALIGSALVTWWTMYDWAIWIAYAPLMGIFFAIIAYGRTVRQFLIVNWILPASFGFVWFSVWGSTALEWQKSGSADIISAIQAGGATTGLWEFLKNVPLGMIIIPVIILALIAAFSTTADTMSTTIAALCTKGARHDEEPAIWQKIIWGVSIGVIACVMVAFGGGAQGVDGVKYLAACGGFVVLVVFIFQVAAAFKVFFFDPETKKDIVDSVDQIEA